ncbi:MAG TPA: response regulator, partial [Kofleriaceae bacterium]|nr:response regulator [Kofleriaceae bacterium]
PELRPDVETQLEHIAFERLRLFLPVLIVGILLALGMSGPSGVPAPPKVALLNGVMIVILLAVYFALRAKRVPGRFAHPVTAFAWLLAPINTLSSYVITGQPALAMILMIELAGAALLVDTVWTLIVTVPVVALGVPLSLSAGRLPVYPASLVGLWVVAMVMQIWLRRWTIRAETHRLDVERTAAQLATELDERKRVQAESDRAQAETERLRDQFVHAQRMDAVGTLSAGLAHDMNNILGGILAFAEVLYTEATNKEVKADLARIRQEAERGAQLTRSLLAFSRRGQYRRRSMLLHSVLDDMTPLLSRTLGKHIMVTRTDGPPTIIDGDPAQLGQVLLNLCLNAADAMSGRGTVTIRTDEVELGDGQVETLSAGRYAKLSIADTGTGMDAETKKRAFEPFFTTKPVGKGTGLGLAMVFGAVEAHGGAIAIDSELGTGTTMTIYIPASEASPALPVSDPKPAPRQEGLVLVVDDEPVVRTATARLVEQLGLSVVTAADGEQAVEIYKQRQKEVVLVMLDMVMPKMPGPECYRALRKLGRTPILLVTGFAADLAAQDLLDTGADGFLEKPYTREQLATEIDRLLGRRAPAAATPTSH